MACAEELKRMESPPRDQARGRNVSFEPPNTEGFIVKYESEYGEYHISPEFPLDAH